MSEKESETKDHQKSEKRELWDQTGWHRPLGGFWYNYIFLLILIIPGLIVLGVIVPAILPFPEALGYNTVVVQLLNVFLILADFGLVESINRFVSANSSKNPKKALQYISFFIWFQIFTGLIQITVVSFYCTTFLMYTNLNYASWFFLVYIMVQWPGMTLVYKYGLGAFQNFDRQTIVDLIQNVGFQSVTWVVFILLGRWWGSQIPQVGELMGSVMGFIVGGYFDDILALFIGGYFFKKTIKPYGFTLKETFLLDFDKELVKEVLHFGWRVLPSRMGFYLVNFLNTLMLTAWLWNYSTLIGLYSIAFAIVTILEVSFSVGPPISEAYNNGKLKLTKFYIEEQFRWWGFISIGMLTVPIIFFFPAILNLIGQDFSGAAAMIFPLFFGAILTFPSDFTGEIARNADMPGTSTILETIKQTTRFFSFLIVLAPWGLISLPIFNEASIITLWLLAEFPGIALKLIIGWIVVRKKIVKIKFPLFQSIIIPVMTVIPMLLMTFGFINFINIVMVASETAGYIIAVLMLLGYLFVFPFLITFPLLGFLGAFDKRSLEHFENALKISGPSHFFVNLIYKASVFGYSKSPFKEKFVIDYEDADKEAKELTLIRSQFQVEKT